MLTYEDWLFIPQTKRIGSYQSSSEKPSWSPSGQEFRTVMIQLAVFPPVRKFRGRVIPLVRISIPLILCSLSRFFIPSACFCFPYGKDYTHPGCLVRQPLGRFFRTVEDKGILDKKLSGDTSIEDNTPNGPLYAPDSYPMG